MTLDSVILIIFRMACLTSFLQAIEMMLISRKPNFLAIWNYENIKGDLERGLPLPRKAIQFLFSQSSFGIILFIQTLISVGGFLHLNVIVVATLFVTNLLICIRFRGNFNGGSDMLTFVVLTGLLISLLARSLEVQKLGLIYIAIHLMYSYLKSGLAKIIRVEWRSGEALPAFLQRSLFKDVSRFGEWLELKPKLSQVFCWTVLLFEISMVGLLFFHSLVPIYFFIAVTFHFINYICFGLNRFFWIWLTAWPAVFYSIALL
jgi:hypothetical protein